jgi:hypothetical protein
MEHVLIGMSLVLLGFVVCFFGLRFWYYLLPLVGAVVGFYAGARLMQDLFGTGFLSTATSWIVGIILAVGAAIVSRLFWYVGVIVMAFTLGALLASGLLHALFDHPWGWVLAITALLVGCLFGAGAIVLHAPTRMVIIGSAFVGAAIMVAGVMLLVGTLTVDDLSDGPAVAVVAAARFHGGSWLWSLAWIVLGAVGVVYQRQSVAATPLPEARWVHARGG